MVPETCLTVLVDLTAYEPHFAVGQSSVSFFNGAPTISKTFDFTAVQHNPTLDRVKNFILMPCLAVLSNHLVRGGVRRLHVGGLGIFLLRLRRRSRWLCFLLVKTYGFDVEVEFSG